MLAIAPDSRTLRTAATDGRQAPSRSSSPPAILNGLLHVARPISRRSGATRVGPAAFPPSRQGSRPNCWTGDPLGATRHRSPVYLFEVVHQPDLGLARGRQLRPLLVRWWSSCGGNRHVVPAVGCEKLSCAGSFVAAIRLGHQGSCRPGVGSGRVIWYPRQESNLGTWFRKPLLYPLSYGGTGGLRTGRSEPRFEAVDVAAAAPARRRKVYQMTVFVP